MTDKEIIDLYNNRDEDAIVETDKKFGKLLFSLANSILADRQDSEETVNDTYKNAWFKIPPDMPNRFIAYLCKITRNLSINLYNKNHAKKRYSGLSIAISELSECLPDKNAQSSEDFIITDSINNFLNGLSREDRVIFIQRYFYCFDIKSISKENNLLQNTVATKLHRMRQLLKDMLNREGVNI